MGEQKVWGRRGEGERGEGWGKKGLRKTERVGQKVGGKIGWEEGAGGGNGFGVNAKRWGK